MTTDRPVNLDAILDARYLSASGRGLEIQREAGAKGAEFARAHGLNITTEWRWSHAERVPTACPAAERWARGLRALERRTARHDEPSTDYVAGLIDGAALADDPAEVLS